MCYFHPACFQMLLRRNWLNTSLSWPLSVTFPFFVGCLNCLWSVAFVFCIIQPSSCNSLITSRTLYFFTFADWFFFAYKVNTFINYYKIFCGILICFVDNFTQSVTLGCWVLVFQTVLAG